MVYTESAAGEVLDVVHELVAAARRGQLHSANGTGDGDHRHAGETERRGVTQQTGSRLAMIGAGCQAGNGRCRKKKKFMGSCSSSRFDRRRG